MWPAPSTYAGGDPVNGSDPSGELGQTLGELNQTDTPRSKFIQFSLVGVPWGHNQCAPPQAACGFAYAPIVNRVQSDSNWWHTKPLEKDLELLWQLYLRGPTASSCGTISECASNVWDLEPGEGTTPNDLFQLASDNTIVWLGIQGKVGTDNATLADVADNLGNALEFLGPILESVSINGGGTCQGQLA